MFSSLPEGVRPTEREMVHGKIIFPECDKFMLLFVYSVIFLLLKVFAR